MARPVLLIAGGSRGIGASCARLAGERGYDVAVNYKSNAKAAADVVEAVKKSGGKAIALQGDMGVEADIVRVFDETASALGPITHFVHSAGIIGKMSRLDDAPAATLRDVIDVNLYGGILCAREAVRRMSTAQGGPGGSIVLISSIAVCHQRRRRIYFLRRRQGAASTRWSSASRARWRRRAFASMPCARGRPIPRSTSRGGSRG